MARMHALRFQCTIPASKTRTPRRAMNKVIETAAETLRRMVPYAFDIDIQPRYSERTAKKLGLVWDLIVVMQFNHRGPLPPNVGQLKLFHDIKKKIAQAN